MDFNLEPLKVVQNNVFVKLNNQDRWYFIGDDNELDATKITLKNDKYSLFIDKKVGDKIIFKNKYSSDSREETIENILSISKYILWQSVQNLQKLSREERWEEAKMIEVSQKDGTIDTKYLLSFLEDLYKQTEPFFEVYCKKNLPLAMLAVTEGGLTNAIGRIQNENRGFINFSTGTAEESENQKDVARMEMVS